MTGSGSLASVVRGITPAQIAAAAKRPKTSRRSDPMMPSDVCLECSIGRRARSLQHATELT